MRFMNYLIDAELSSERFDSALKVKIISGNNKTLVTSIPDKSGEVIKFAEKEEVKVSYYHGEFVYSFALIFHEKIEADGEEHYEFTIDEVLIDNNYRKHKREIVEFKGLIMNSREIIYCTILDVSDSGMKFETELPIDKRKIELHYADEQNNTLKTKGKIVWSKKVSDTKFQYGFKFK